MHGFEEFGDIVKTQEPLAPYTSFKVGGPAELLVQPRSIPELTAVVKRCSQQKVPMRVLCGCFLILLPYVCVLVVVLLLIDSSFTQVSVDCRLLRSGAG